ncbi:MAG: PKD domain-containing protein [Bacteroidetes bacterium]|nr:PKD domain-containing protein [Bacteroidota bacterium]
MTVNFKDTTTGSCIWQSGPWSPSTWFWDFGDGTTSTQQNPSHTYAASGTYNVKLVVTCPKDSIIIPVTVSLPGTVGSIPNVPPICVGSSAVLTVTGGSTYAWSTGATTATITVTPTVTTTYSVILTGTCPNTLTTSVVVNPSPTVTIGSNSPVCLNQTLNFTSGGGTTYAWSGPNGFTSTQQNPNITNVTMTAAGVYSLTVTNSNGCSATANITVAVNPALTVIFKADTVCKGSNTMFTDLTAGVAPGSTYNWSFGDGTSSAQANNTTHTYLNSGTYTCTLAISSSGGCTNSGTLQVVVKALPLVDHVNSPQYCPGQTTLPINFTSTPGGSSSSFYWTNLNTAIGLGASGSVNVPAFTTINSGTTSVTSIVLVHASFNGCTGPDSSFTITINLNPLADFHSQNKICQGSSMQLLDNSTGNIAMWNWDMNNDGNFSDATTQNPSYTFTTPGTHTVGLIVAINGSCKDTVKKTVYINPIPQAAFTGINLKGCPLLNVNFTDHSTIIAPSQIVNWSWNYGNGATTSGQFPPTVAYGNNSQTQTVNYTVSLTVTSDSGCVATAVKPNYVTVYPRPKADFTYVSNSNETDGIDPTVHFYDASSGATYVNWNLGDVFANPAIINYTSVTNPVHVYLHEEAYVYYATQWAINSYGCKDSITKPIEVKPGFTFYIPNAFTPNGDGTNEGFKGTGIGIDNSTYHLQIFDRWGNLIFKANDLEKTWDGRVKEQGEVVQEDVYVWKADFNDSSGKKHEYKGTVSIVK